MVPWSISRSLIVFENSQKDPSESPIRAPNRHPRALSLTGSFRHFRTYCENWFRSLRLSIFFITISSRTLLMVRPGGSCSSVDGDFAGGSFPIFLQEV